MRKRELLKMLATSGVALGPLASLRVRAEDGYPNKAIQLVVPFAAGGTTDSMARRLGNALALRLKQPVVMQNKPGAAGAIGALYTLNAQPDGYTALFTSTALVQAPLLMSKPSFDEQRDFIPVAMTCVSPVVLGVPAQLNVHTTQELVAYLRAHKGKTSYASSGPGTTSHIYGEEFKRRFGLDTTHVPYSGDAKSTLDLIANRVQFFITTVAGLYPLSTQGSVRLLALSGSERMATIPNVPTFKEQGVDGFETVGWFGIFVASKTPAPVVRILREEVTRIAQSADYLAFLNDIKMMPALKADFAGEVRSTQEAWAELVRLNHIHVD